MKIPKEDALLPCAKRLRRDMTPHERKLWFLFLRKYPVKFYKQRILRSYIVDFYCARAKLVVELDGSQHYEDAGTASDRQRDADLRSFGLEILRFSNREIDREFAAVCEKIDLTVKARTSPSPSAAAPLPPPPRGGGKDSENRRLSRSPLAPP